MWYTFLWCPSLQNNLHQKGIVVIRLDTRDEVKEKKKTYTLNFEKIFVAVVSGWCFFLFARCLSAWTCVFSCLHHGAFTLTMSHIICECSFAIKMEQTWNEFGISKLIEATPPRNKTHAYFAWKYHPTSIRVCCFPVCIKKMYVELGIIIGFRTHTQAQQLNSKCIEIKQYFPSAQNKHTTSQQKSTHKFNVICFR